MRIIHSYSSTATQSPLRQRHILTEAGLLVRTGGVAEGVSEKVVEVWRARAMRRYPSDFAGGAVLGTRGGDDRRPEFRRVQGKHGIVARLAQVPGTCPRNSSGRRCTVAQRG
ncbi:hypothetical protein ACFXJ8_34455 [Nonomuraea sp. NPDC059194]|uniref:hypothetical protein n=1 Tax=Nonomuraea sp. NPDC059194 TaxID=3346764 RepID=UPI003685AB02